MQFTVSGKVLKVGRLRGSLQCLQRGRVIVCVAVKGFCGERTGLESGMEIGNEGWGGENYRGCEVVIGEMIIDSSGG